VAALAGAIASGSVEFLHTGFDEQVAEGRVEHGGSSERTDVGVIRGDQRCGFTVKRLPADA
jgi:hypothetical protein